MVGTIKGGMRKMFAHIPDSKWGEVYPDVLRGARVLNSRATGYSPYTLVFKTEPALPIANALHVVDWEGLTDTQMV